MWSSSTAVDVRPLSGMGAWLGSAVALSVVLVGCATEPKDPEARAAFQEANDPIEPANRDVFAVNLAIDDNVVKPAAEAYRELPEPIRKGFHNLLQTFRAPALFANFVMQGDFGAAAETLMRTFYNLVAGLGGTIDVAAATGLPMKDTDFGITLAKWGIGEGPYLMLPLFGPSNPRDTTGLVVDSFLDPVGYFTTFGEDAGRYAFNGIDQREPNIEPFDEIRKTSIDFYATLRSLYRQRREGQIRGTTPGSNIPAPEISQDPLPSLPADLEAPTLAAQAPSGKEISEVQ